VIDEDQTTAIIKKNAQHWRKVYLKSNEQLHELIIKDKIDILVDLTGHTSRNRLLVFAGKPAPVQVTYLGCPCTTGLTSIDYRFTDNWADPPGMTEQLHSEKLIRLHPSFLFFQPPGDSPVPKTGQEKINGPVTFGSFNNALKISPKTVSLWAQILKETPDSRLILKSVTFATKEGRRHFEDQFKQHGIEGERLELVSFIFSSKGHLQLYDKIDIALDPFPYNGTTTTCEALWMGTPVITLAGRSHVSRVGCSIISNVEVPELIADSENDYLRIAVQLARDNTRRQDLQSCLREKIANSPLMKSSTAFVRELELQYRAMWRRWCKENG